MKYPELNYTNEINNILQGQEVIDKIEEMIVKAESADAHFKWLTAFCLERSEVYGDGEKVSLQLLNEILKENPFDVKSILLKGFIEDKNYGSISEITMAQINELRLQLPNLSNVDVFLFQHLKLLIAFYYANLSEIDKYELTLKNAIKDNPQYPKYYFLMGLQEKERGNNEMANFYFQEFLDNIESITIDYDLEANMYDLNDMIREYFTELNISSSRLLDILKIIHE